MLGQYESDSDSDAPVDAESKGLTEAAALREKPEDEESEEESEEEDEAEEGKSKRLPSASKAFATMQEAELGFKQFANAKEERRKVKAAADRHERVPAASAATLREQVGQVKRSTPDEDAAQDSADGKGGKGKGKDKGMTVKDRTRLKRIKGQSGIDHNGKVWKPEAWMQMRNEFD
mmetsp:Transcript_23045/g.42459  ORF Transcript_23045/g.42459 Transcript_23045/m.42459 type:complete len:176 (-) Transcript_23045:57-584(-)